MNSGQQQPPTPDTRGTPRPNGDVDYPRLLASAMSLIDQAPPPSIRDILSAYRAQGDGDRDMLLAMLNAKTAEDERIGAVTSLHLTLLQTYQHEPLAKIRPQSYTYPPPYPQFTCDQSAANPQQARPHRLNSSSGSRSPMHQSRNPYMDQGREHCERTRDKERDPHVPSSGLLGCKRPRPTSSNPTSSGFEMPLGAPPAEQFPPSPYSSSGHSDSGDYSPRSRASMAIGSLLSSSRRVAGEQPLSQEGMMRSS